MTQVNIIEPDFLNRDCTKYKLFLLVSRGSLSFFVLSPLGRLMLLRRMPLAAKQREDDWDDFLYEIRSFLKQEKTLHLPFKEVTIGIELDASSMVPGTQHYDQDLASVFSLTLPNTDKHSLLITEDEHLNLTFLYTINSELVSLLKNFFPTSKMIYGSVGAIRFYRLLSDKMKNNIVAININPPGLSISVLHLGRLKFFNSYHIADANDLIYYVMLVNNKLRLKASSTTYYVTGAIGLDSSYMNQLKRYVPEIQFPDAQEIITFSEQSLPWSKHHFLDLFSLYLCE